MIVVNITDGQTDGWTDRQTTYSCMTALCVASCGKNAPKNYVSFNVALRDYERLVSLFHVSMRNFAK